MIDIDIIEAVLGRDLTDNEQVRAVRLAQLAVGLIEGALPGFTLDPDSETVTVYANGGALWTPRYPLADEPVVTIGGSVVSSPQWNLWGRIEFAASSLNEFEINGWPSSTPIQIEYPFGFEDLPVDIEATIAAMVSAAIQRQSTGGVQSESLGSYNVSYGDWSVQQAARGMTVPEGALNRWKRNRQVSVALTP